MSVELALLSLHLFLDTFLVLEFVLRWSVRSNQVQKIRRIKETWQERAKTNFKTLAFLSQNAIVTAESHRRFLLLLQLALVSACQCLILICNNALVLHAEEFPVRVLFNLVTRLLEVTALGGEKEEEEEQTGRQTNTDTDRSKRKHRHRQIDR